MVTPPEQFYAERFAKAIGRQQEVPIAIDRSAALD
jgi:hypothetical protein